MTLTVCWSAKGGSGTTVVAAALALGSAIDSLLIDLDGELPAALGVPEPSGQGLSDWFASDAPERSVLDLAVDVARPTRLVPRGPSAIPEESARWPALRAFLATSPLDVVVDAGCGAPPAALLAEQVTRPARHPSRATSRCRGPAACRDPTASCSSPNTGRSLTAADVARPIGAPVVARVAIDPAIARAVDAGLLAARLPGVDGQVAAGPQGRRMSTPSTLDDGDVDERLVDGVVPGRTGRAGQRRGRRAGARPPARPARRRRRTGTARRRRRRPPRRSRPARRADPRRRRRRGARQRRRRDLGRASRSSSSDAARIAAADLAVVIERILAPLGRRLDRTTPIVDARLGDGTRVCAVVPPISVDGTILSLRRFRAEPLPLTAFGGRAVTEALGELVERRCNTVISGATSSGKTSLLSSLLGLTRPASASCCSRTRPSWLRSPITSSAWRPARRATTALPAISVEQLLHTALAAAARPPRRRRGARPRGARARPGAEHRSRRFVVDVSRQQRPRRPASPRDARRPGRSGVAAAGRPRPPRALHRRRRPRRANSPVARAGSARSPR